MRRWDASPGAPFVIASSTSGRMMSDIQRDCATPQGTVIGHPFNPPCLLPLVEFVGGKGTESLVAISSTRACCSRSKRPNCTTVQPMSCLNCRANCRITSIMVITVAMLKRGTIRKLTRAGAGCAAGASVLPMAGDFSTS